jgi:catechol 2,3-dioxygenase-like lactoylglutathione lyase family enzyme
VTVAPVAGAREPAHSPDETNMPVTRVVPIVKVTDIQRALEFYCSTLGFVQDFMYSAGPGGPEYAGISLDGNQVHLSTFAGDSVIGAATYCYVDDVDALFHKFLAAGLRTPGNPQSPVEEGPVDQTWGMREFYVRDPDKNTMRFGSRILKAG